MAAFPISTRNGMATSSTPASTSFSPPSSTLSLAPKAGASTGRDSEMSLVNLAARQRMLSQRMVLQTVLAARGSDLHMKAARSSLALFTDSQAKLVDTAGHLDAANGDIIRKTYHGPNGVGATIDAFAQQVGTTLDLAERHSPRVEDALARLVESTDSALEALNTATTAFDQVGKAKSETLMKELAGIVASIQTVAREAKVVSFNAQVMAARAGQHGREFAVVANVLSGITNEIDGLSLQAVSLAGRSRGAA
ncbi:methyl-accepting chemotaxis protein [Acidovorax sp.]|uniref:methyl-accepting chemotaxis protein n=1 Tax=Acidovorax sp. TaxID=1872122 RepID=UPI0027BB0568|nr:methyl-accepting chemotaxis protein [Acidovorax sp.]